MFLQYSRDSILIGTMERIHGIHQQDGTTLSDSSSSRNILGGGEGGGGLGGGGEGGGGLGGGGPAIRQQVVSLKQRATPDSCVGKNATKFE